MNKYAQVPNVYLIDYFKQHNTKEEFDIMEVGCNAGINLKAIHEIYPKARYYGIDISREAIIQARENFPEATFLCGDAEELYSPEELFDYVFFPDVLEHLTQPEKVLNHFKKLLKPDGVIYATIPNLMHWSIIGNLIKFGIFKYTETGLLDYDHKHLFTLKEIYDLFEKECGLKIDEIMSIKINNIPEDKKEFFNTLVDLSFGNVHIDHYETFTYMLRASKLDKE